MAKAYHINTMGEPGICRAAFKCPFGALSEHYASKEGAQKAYELSMEGAFIAASLEGNNRLVATNNSSWNHLLRTEGDLTVLGHEEVYRIAAGLSYAEEKFPGVTEKARNELDARGLSAAREKINALNQLREDQQVTVDPTSTKISELPLIQQAITEFRDKSMSEQERSEVDRQETLLRDWYYTMRLQGENHRDSMWGIYTLDNLSSKDSFDAKKFYAYSKKTSLAEAVRNFS